VRICSALVGLLGWLCPWAADAGELPATFSVDYRAPVSCPGEAAFVRSILARSQTARLASGELAEVRFRAEISEREGLTQGVLVVELARGTSFRRAVPEAPCADVVASMAIIAAMVLDAVASGSEIPAEAEPPPPEPRSTEPVPVPPIAPVAAPPSAPLPSPGTRPPRLALSVGLAARVVGESAVAPRMYPGEEVGLDWLLDVSEQWLPSFRLSGLHVVSPPVHTSLGNAQFRFLAVRLSLCPTRWPAHSAFGVRPCLNGDGGELRVKGLDTQNPRTRRVTWWAAGPSARLECLPWRWAGLELEAGLVFPGRHDSFVFQPGPVLVHRVPDLGTSVGLGAVLRFP
jgi:hypothetical protein